MLQHIRLVLAVFIDSKGLLDSDPVTLMEELLSVVFTFLASIP